MEANFKKIGVLTSGGDAPGMNAAVRAVVRTMSGSGIETVAIYNGYNGLITGEIKPLKVTDVSSIIQKGGTILFSARSKEFRTEEGVEKAARICRENGIDGIIAIGGDGTFRGARDLCRHGIPTIGIPATIDNDITSTEYTIGFDTAVNTVIDVVDRLRDTCSSHHRCSVVEVMGRRAGHIAVHAAIASGASYVIVNEMEFDREALFAKMERAMKLGKQHFIIIVAEGRDKVVRLVDGKEKELSFVDALSEEIEERTGVEARSCVLAHCQRGGSPTVRDRVQASKLGYYAAKYLMEGKSNAVVALQNGEAVTYDIEEALQMTKTIDMDLVRIANAVSL